MDWLYIVFGVTIVGFVILALADEPDVDEDEWEYVTPEQRREYDEVLRRRHRASGGNC